MQNLFVVRGRLVEAPVLGTSKGEKNTDLCEFRIANEVYQGKDKDGKSKIHTNFIPCTAWAGQARALADNCVQGQEVEVTGKMILDSYTDKENVRRTSAKVNVTTIEFGQKPKAKEDTAKAAEVSG